MLTAYIQAAIDKINWKILPDGTFYAEIPELPGVHATHVHLEACQRQIREMLEEHIVLSLYRHSPLPAINGVELKVKETR